MAVLIRNILAESEQKYGKLTAVKWLNKKEEKELSYSELLSNAAAIRRGLLAAGFDGKHIALIGTGSAEWIETYLGIITGNTVAIPLDAGLPSEDLTDLINRSDSEAVFLSPKKRLITGEILAQCPKVRKIWILENDGGGEAEYTASPYSEIKEVGQNTQTDVMIQDPEAVATIIFTSGTTGKSKGVMLTQNNLAENVRAVEFTSDPGTTLLSVLPVHHAFCLVMDWLKGFSLGACICVNDSFLHMVRNMGIFQPDVMLMVPMMIETIYKRLASADPAIPKKMVAEKVFGKNLKIIFTGGAHLDPYYIDRFAEYGINVLEGYGMSECSPVISSNNPDMYRAGSVGKPLCNIEVAFQNGEILVRGSSVMKGYYKMCEETAETLKDGWLHTGDKGYLDKDGFLYINGRIKNLIILSNGENISPEELENKIALHPLVAEVIVIGAANGLTALIYPDREAAAAQKLDEEAIGIELQAFLDEYNKKQPTYRQITGLKVRKNPFIRNATQKIKRQEAMIDEPSQLIP